MRAILGGGLTRKNKRQGSWPDYNSSPTAILQQQNKQRIKQHLEVIKEWMYSWSYVFLRACVLSLKGIWISRQHRMDTTVWKMSSILAPVNAPEASMKHRTTKNNMKNSHSLDISHCVVLMQLHRNLSKCSGCKCNFLLHRESHTLEQNLGKRAVILLPVQTG